MGNFLHIAYIQEKIPPIVIISYQTRKMIKLIFHFPMFLFDNMENMKKQQIFEFERIKVKSGSLRWSPKVGQYAKL